LTALERITHFFELAGNDLHLLKHDYFVIGSAAMVLAGCEMYKIGDINLLTSSADANFLKEQWKDRQVKDHVYAYDRIFRSNSGRFRFKGVDAEVMGNLEVNAGQQWVPLLVRQFMNVTVAGMQVKIPTIKEQHRIYRFFGRPKDIQKAQLLLKHL
jgi:hypothetical protein